METSFSGILSVCRELLCMHCITPAYCKATSQRVKIEEFNCGILCCILLTRTGDLPSEVVTKDCLTFVSDWQGLIKSCMNQTILNYRRLPLPAIIRVKYSLYVYTYIPHSRAYVPWSFIYWPNDNDWLMWGFLLLYYSVNYIMTSPRLGRMFHSAKTMVVHRELIF